MKLIAKLTPYSSVVGGGLTLSDEAGRARFMVMVCGTTAGITKEESVTISEHLSHAFDVPLELPERE